MIKSMFPPFRACEIATAGFYKDLFPIYYCIKLKAYLL